uniref:Uncharacterized protein n=1 Tax=Anopheles albimanus TaxID=7167 RepID=A0A182FQE2_ANOAL
IFSNALANGRACRSSTVFLPRNTEVLEQLLAISPLSASAYPSLFLHILLVKCASLCLSLLLAQVCLFVVNKCARLVCIEGNERESQQYPFSAACWSRNHPSGLLISAPLPASCEPFIPFSCLRSCVCVCVC